MHQPLRKRRSQLFILLLQFFFASVQIYLSLFAGRKDLQLFEVVGNVLHEREPDSQKKHVSTKEDCSPKHTSAEKSQ